MAYTTIKKSSDYFNTKLYTGNSSSQAITGVGFAPDLVWSKGRQATSRGLFHDTIRGATKYIDSTRNIAETTNVQGLTAFGSDGFSLGTAGEVNYNGDTFVAWNWKANGAGVANTDGSISSTVSANTTSGFSIVSYTGTGTDPETIGHGLGVTPSMIIVKDRNTAGGWRVYHKSVGNDKVLALDGTIAGTTSDAWNSTTPTPSLFTVGNDTITNGNGTTHIAYCFNDVQGFSKFGSYLGNGNADGTFIYTGFKPAWFMVKQTNAAGNSWHILDNKRDSFNVMEKNLRANLSNAEFDTGVDFDFLSNGVKMRNTDGASNNFGGSTYIYMAFAEQPLVGDNPATAR